MGLDFHTDLDICSLPVVWTKEETQIYHMLTSGMFLSYQEHFNPLNKNKVRVIVSVDFSILFFGLGKTS